MNIRQGDTIICVKSQRGICSVGNTYKVLYISNGRFLIEYGNKKRKTWVTYPDFKSNVQEQRKKKLEKIRKNSTE
jgi:hypothetical protein